MSSFSLVHGVLHMILFKTKFIVLSARLYFKVKNVKFVRVREMGDSLKERKNIQSVCQFGIRGDKKHKLNTVTKIIKLWRVSNKSSK